MVSIIARSCLALAATMLAGAPLAGCHATTHSHAHTSTHAHEHYLASLEQSPRLRTQAEPPKHARSRAGAREEREERGAKQESYRTPPGRRDPHEPRGEPSRAWKCDKGEACAEVCEGAGCKMRCAKGATCKLDCPGGDCTMHCSRDASCEDADGGGPTKERPRERKPRKQPRSG
jgi:hypothetical protein